MASSFEVDFDDAQLKRAIDRFPDQVDKALTAVMHYEAPKAQAYMRTHAKWTDRTTNARNGLFAQVVSRKGDEYGIDLAHSVPYGIWLEVRWNGKYAIILPTVRQTGREVMKTVQGLFRELDRS